MIRIEYKKGDSETRPWGSWRVMTIARDHIAKHVVVLPHSRTSLQVHAHRDERLTVLQGAVEITAGDKIYRLTESETLMIEKGTAHRIANVTGHVAELVEVQTGVVLDESDIERLDDDYGRIETA